MSILKLAEKSMVVDVVSNFGYRGEGANDGGMWMFGNEGIDLHFKFNGHQSCIDAYTKCPPVAAIINKKSQAFINGKTNILNSQGTPATSLEAKKIAALLKRPNPLQSGKQFEAQLFSYYQLFGFTMLLPMKPVGFPNTDATQLWNIPPFMIDIQETKNLFYQNPAGIISKIVLNYKGQKSIIDATDVVIIEDFTLSFTSLIIPESRLKAVSMPINNIIGAYESRNVLINYRGALGILGPEKDPMGTIALSPKDKQDLQTQFQRYGLKQQQWQMIISNASLKWQQMGYPTKDLMLFEEVEESTKAICDAFNYPYRLLNYDGGALSGSDVKQFQKQLYSDAIIPEAESVYEQLNQFFGTNALNLRLTKDYGHMSILQEDVKLAAEALFMVDRASQMEFLCNIITQNQWRTRTKVPTTADGDCYYSEIKDKIGLPKVTAGQVTENNLPTNE